MANSERKTFNFQLDTPEDRTWLETETTRLGLEKSSQLMRAVVRAYKRMTPEQRRQLALVDGKPEIKEASG